MHTRTYIHFPQFIPFLSGSYQVSLSEKSRNRNKKKEQSFAFDTDK